ncbi:MAG TPA: carboxypeptidase-like regulatory domain-containing protein, partial [Chitinophagaceae bacterium]|nr:carboxypeptidase-like regulatory domain-containing protein [Chitinophagaceae bacterium]
MQPLLPKGFINKYNRRNKHNNFYLKKIINPYYFLPLLITLLSFSSVTAQEIPVTFKIVTQKGEGVSFATISVTPIKDSIKSLEKITDSSGLATFQLLNGGLYKIKISSVNYAAIEKNIT